MKFAVCAFEVRHQDRDRCRDGGTLTSYVSTAVLDAMLEVRPSRPSCGVVGKVNVHACNQEQQVADADAPCAVF